MLPNQGSKLYKDLVLIAQYATTGPYSNILLRNKPVGLYGYSCVWTNKTNKNTIKASLVYVCKYIVRVSETVMHLLEQ